LKTWVSADAGPEATIEALMSVIACFRPPVRKVLRKVEYAVAGWRPTGQILGMADREVENFADAFEHPERAAAQRLCVIEKSGWFKHGLNCGRIFKRRGVAEARSVPSSPGKKKVVDALGLMCIYTSHVQRTGFFRPTELRVL
jgi:hypothetical protein